MKKTKSLGLYEEFLKIEELAQKIAFGDTYFQEKLERLRAYPFAIMIYNFLATLKYDSLTCPSDPEEQAPLTLNMTNHGQGAPPRMARCAPSGKLYLLLPAL